MDISRQVSLRFATWCLQQEQRTLTDELGMIRTQVGSTIDQLQLYGMLCTIQPLDSNQ
jgi:biotin operon repressor